MDNVEPQCEEERKRPEMVWMGKSWGDGHAPSIDTVSLVNGGMVS